MAVAFPQDVGPATITAASSTTIAQAITISAGSRIAAFVVGDTGTAATATFTDNSGSGTVWQSTLLGPLNISNVRAFAGASRQFAAGGTFTVTCTFSAAMSSRGIVLVEVTGADNNAAQDAQGQTQNPVSAGTDLIFTPNLTASGAGGLVAFTRTNGGLSVCNAGTGMTAGGLYWSAGGDASRVESKTVSAGTVAATWSTTTGGAAWWSMGIIFGAAASAAPVLGRRRAPAWTDEDPPAARRRARLVIDGTIVASTVLRPRRGTFAADDDAFGPPRRRFLPPDAPAWIPWIPRWRRSSPDAPEDTPQARRRLLVPPNAAPADPVFFRRRPPAASEDEPAVPGRSPRRPIGVSESVGLPNVPGLQLWLRADLGVVMPGGSVQAWLDQSGHSNNDTASFLATPPVSSINGQQAFRFTGTEHFTGGTDVLVGSSPRTIIVVHRPSGTTYGSLVTLRTGTLKADYFPPYSSANGLIYTDGVNPANNASIAPHDISGQPTITMWQSAGPGQVLVFRENATRWPVSQPSGSSTDSGTTGFTIGGGGAALTSYVGDICEILVWDNAISSSDEAAIFAYLAVRYGIDVVGVPKPRHLSTADDPEPWPLPRRRLLPQSGAVAPSDTVLRPRRVPAWPDPEEAFQARSRLIPTGAAPPAADTVLRPRRPSSWTADEELWLGRRPEIPVPVAVVTSTVLKPRRVGGELGETWWDNSQRRRLVLPGSSIPDVPLTPPFTTVVDPVRLSTWVDSVQLTSVVDAVVLATAVDSVLLTVAVDPVRLSLGERLKPRKTTDTYPITNTLVNNGSPVPLAGYTVTINIVSQDRTTVKRANGACTIIDAPNGRVSYQVVAGDVDTAGSYLVEWKAVSGTGVPYHFPQDGYEPLEIQPSLG